jgi:hypothetical protein
MACSNCHKDNLEIVNNKTDGQGYYEEEDYVCLECGEEWTWKMTKEITKKGKNRDDEAEDE